MQNQQAWATVAVTFGVLGFMAYALHQLEGAEEFLLNPALLGFFGLLVGGGAWAMKKSREE